MAATITGIVFQDTNHNGQYTEEKPGIPNSTVVLYQSSMGCVETVSDSGGRFAFTVTTPGVYTIYETVTAAGMACPPATFTQPPGYTMSNGPRMQTVTITEAQVVANDTIAGFHFSHDIVDSPFPCEPEMILFAGRPTEYYLVSPVSGRSVAQGNLTPANDVNAIGYNVLDNYVYGYDQTANTIVRVGNDRTLIALYPRPNGLPAAAYTVGTMDQRGFYYLYVSDTNRFYTVDLRENSATFLKLVDPTRGYEEQTSNFGTPMTTPISIGDWVVSPVDENLYGVDSNGVMLRVTPYDGTVTLLDTTGPNPGNRFGAMAVDANGAIFAVSNSDGTLYRYQVSGDTATGVRFGTTVQNDFIDATMCPYQVIELDFGDAPDAGGGGGSGNYNTVLANNGPRHGLVRPLYLGSQVTPEEDARQNATATGDDLTMGIQDDGITGELPPLSLQAQSYELPVLVTNQTAETAWLYAWVDFNKNGLFEADEAVGPVAIGPYTTEIHLLTSVVSPNVTLTPGHTFVRLRLTTDMLTDTDTEAQDTRSVGPASDGEVEDYILKMGTTTDLTILKTADVQVLQTGDTIIYTITVVNAGAEDALNTIVTDILPLVLNDPQYSLDAGSTWDHWSGALSLGTLPAGQTVTILLRGIFDGSSIDPVVNTAKVTTTSDDPNPDNNQSTVTTPVNRAANLFIEKTADRQTASAGESLTYTIQVRNAGPDTAENTIVTDAVPVELESPAYSVDDGQNWFPWTGQLSLGDIPVDTVQSFLIRGTVEAGASGTIHNTAEVASAIDDPDPNDNQSTIELPIEASADLSITKSGTPNPVGSGQKIVYTIVVTNSGPADAQEVTLQEILPDALTDLEYSLDYGASWNPWNTPYAIGTLLHDSTETLLLRATVTVPDARTISNTITVSSTTPDPDPSNNAYIEDVEVVLSADLAVTKGADRTTAISGEQLTYTLTVRNDGPAQATNVTLADEVPSGLVNPEFSTDDGVSWNPWVSPYQIGALASGESVTVLVRGTVEILVDGNLVNTVVVSGDELDPVPDNNSDTVTTPATSSADLTITKTASAENVFGGDTLTYTVTIDNNGPSAAQNVVLDDAVPSGLVSVQFSTNGGTSWHTWTGSYRLGTLQSGTQTVVMIRGIVSPSASGSLVNTASVNASTPDPNPDDNVATVTTPVIDSANLSVKKLGYPNPALVGAYVTYTIVYANAGPSDAENVTLTDSVPSALRDVQFSIDGGDTWNPWVSPYTMGTVPQGSSATLFIRGTVAASAVGTITNTATIGSTTPDPDPSDNSSTEIIPIATSADLTVTKSASPDPANVNQLLTYTITVTNHGPSDAQSVAVEDLVPSVLENAEYTVDGGTTWNPWMGSHSFGVIENGASRILQIRSTVGAEAAGVLSNTATVTSATPDPNPNDNTTTVLTPVGTSADLSIVKTGTPNPAIPGQLLTYTLTVTNGGPDDAAGVTLTDTIPSQLSGAEFSVDGGVTWNPWVSPYDIGTVGDGASVAVQIRGTLLAGTTGTLTNTASVGSTTPDPNPDNNQVTEITPIGASADVRVEKQAVPSPVSPGAQIQYTIVVTNAGPNQAEDVILTDAVPSAVQNPEFSTDGGATWNPWTGTYQAGALEASGQLQVEIRGTVSPHTTDAISNTVSVASSTPDPVPDNNQDTVETPIVPTANLSVSKSSTPNPAVPGQLVTYTVIARNAGPSDAVAVSIIDTVPSSLEEPEASADGGVTWTPWTGTYLAAVLEAGDTITLQIRGRLMLATSGQLVNTAVVFSQTPDPDPSDNAATDTTPITPSADISILKNARPSPAIPGQVFTYILTAANAGPTDAQNVVIKDALPMVVTGGEYSLDYGITWMPWTGEFTLGTLASGTTRVVLLRGTLPDGITGTIINTATITSSTHDPNLDNNTATIETTIAAPADLSVRKTVNPETALQGGVLTYTVTVTNHGPANAEEVTLSDAAIINALTNVQCSLDHGATWDSFTGALGIGTLENQSEQTVLLRGTVPSTATGVLVNAATVDSTTPDPVPDNNTATITTPVTASADVSVTKTSQPNPAVPGQQIIYTISITNSGPSPAERVMLTDSIASSISGAEFSTDGGANWSPWKSPYTIGTIAAESTVTILIRGMLQTAASGQLANTATVTSGTPDPVPENNTVTDVTPVQETADLSIQKVPHPNPAIPGQHLTYTILVNNAGPADAQNVVVSDITQGALFSLDGGVTWNPWRGSYQFGTVGRNTVVSILLRVNVPADALNGVTNTADVTSETPDPNPDNNTVTIVTPIAQTADLELQKSGTPDVVTQGDELTYSITINNLGANDAENVQLKDLIPNALSNVAFSMDRGTTWNPWVSPLALGTVEDGGTRTVLIRGTVSVATNAIVNTASVSSSTPDPDYSNNADQVLTNISNRGEANLSVTKTAITDPVIPGQRLTYRVTIQNSGPDAAENVILYDAVGPELSAMEYSLDNSLTWSTWRNPHNFGALASGSTVQLLIRGTLDARVTGTVANSVIVSSTTYDPDLSDNIVRELVTILGQADVSITKKADRSSVHPCETVQYTLTASNAGPATAEHVVIVDKIENAVYSTNGGITWNPWPGAYKVGALPYGKTVTLLLQTVVNAKASGVITNTATISSTTPDPNSENNSSTVTLPVEKSADLMITKLVCPSVVNPCEELLYRITVVNYGPDTAKEVVVTDHVPESLCDVRYSVDGTCEWRPWCGQLSLGTIPCGGHVSFQISGTVDRCARGAIVNQVSVSASTRDPNPENNTASATAWVHTDCCWINPTLC